MDRIADKHTKKKKHEQRLQFPLTAHYFQVTWSKWLCSSSHSQCNSRLTTSLSFLHSNQQKSASTIQRRRFVEVKNKRSTAVKYLPSSYVSFFCFFSSWAEKWTLPQFYYCTVNLWLCLLCLLCSTSDVERHPACHTVLGGLLPKISKGHAFVLRGWQNMPEHLSLSREIWRYSDRAMTLTRLITFLSLITIKQTQSFSNPGRVCKIVWVAGLLKIYRLVRTFVFMVLPVWCKKQKRFQQTEY